MTYYFYYFQDYQTKLYYGGITNNAIKRQYKHQEQLNKNLKSDKKLWHLYQDKIQLITLWTFNTKKEACVYEKQWIINNYLNPLCLNCSVSNSEYEYKNHAKISELNNGHKAKVRYALEVNSPKIIHIFKSSTEAAKFTGVLQCNVSNSCKNAKPYNGLGRWLFSDVSKKDLQAKFKSLTKTKIKGTCNRPFILINKITKEPSQIFYSVYEPQKQNYKVNHSNLSQCLLGKVKSVNGYYTVLVI